MLHIGKISFCATHASVIQTESMASYSNSPTIPLATAADRQIHGCPSSLSLADRLEQTHELVHGGFMAASACPRTDRRVGPLVDIDLNPPSAKARAVD